MYVRDPLRVVVTGPLGRYRNGFCVELERHGYAGESACKVVRLMAHLSRWLGSEHLEPAALTSEVIERFLEDRRRHCRTRRTERATPLLAYLRGIDVVPVAELTSRDNDHDMAMLLRDYRHYLRCERGLAATSIRRYMLVVLPFLSRGSGPIQERLERLSAPEVIEFVMEQAGQRSKADTKCLVTALRSLLRYLFVIGRITRELASVVPTVANRKLGSLPGRVAPGQAGLLLDSCRRDTAIGRRDFAVLTLLSRLGLRTCEVAAIEVGDIDWRTGILTVRGKGGYRDELPLPSDVGQALVGYLVDGRPAGCATANLLVSARAPWRAVSATAIQTVVARACARAGIPRGGAHRLRHTVASDLLDAGASLPEIGQVLRHRSQLSTATYAKIDHARLRTLARPWPAGAR